ncbi:polysaccharide lyase beta-sandwich domain-containing protein [Enterococcus sp.]|uniref:polysaccharide lyase beta-sandwich domain-containing protein n=1 Tax=Enterococcus sp. TaxID=35783 RepID=UPI003994F06D
MANIWNKASLLGGLLEIDQPVSLIIKDLGENTYQLTATDPRQSDDPINFNFKYPVHIRKKQADGFSVNQDLLTLKTKGLAGASRSVVVTVDVPTDKAALEGVNLTCGKC